MSDVVGMKECKREIDFNEFGVVMTCLFTIHDPNHPAEEVPEDNLGEPVKMIEDPETGEMRPEVMKKPPGTCCTIF